MSGTIQAGTAQLLDATGPALALAYSNSQVIMIQAQTHDVYAAYSEVGLQSEQSRFVIRKGDSTSVDEVPYALIIQFPLAKSSGTIFFASKNAAATAKVQLWSFACGGEY